MSVGGNLGMRPPINRQLLGLMGLLDVQNSGRSPGYVDDAVNPVLPIDRFLISQPQQFNGTGNIAVVGSNISTLVVPAGFAWIVTAFNIATNALAAANTLIAAPAIFGPAPGNQLKYQGNYGPSLITADVWHGTFGPPAQWFIAGPGDQFGCVTMRIAGAAIPMFTVVQAVAVRI